MLAVKVSDIHRAAAFIFNISGDVVTSPSRCRRYCRARWAAMYLTRKYTRLSYPQIGRYFGGRDHSTVMYGIRRISDMAAADGKILARVASVEAVARKFAALRIERDSAHVLKLCAEIAPD